MPRMTITYSDLTTSIITAQITFSQTIDDHALQMALDILKILLALCIKAVIEGYMLQKQEQDERLKTELRELEKFRKYIGEKQQE